MRNLMLAAMACAALAFATTAAAVVPIYHHYWRRIHVHHHPTGKPKHRPVAHIVGRPRHQG